MKRFTILLAFYLFALNLTPCSDTAITDDAASSEISQGISDNHQHQDTDLCSPFCICQCCQISVTNFHFIDFKFNTAYISTQDFFYLNGSERNFNTSVLQPPRA